MVHGNLMASNIVRIGSHIGLVDFESATLFKSKEDSSVLSDKAAGVSQRISSGVLPPELIARFDLSTDKAKLQQYENHWNQILNDSIDFNLLNSDDIHTISLLLESFQDQDKLLNRSHGALGSLVRKFNTPVTNSDMMSEEDWREQLSEALQDISVDDLPDSLAECETIEQLRTVWNRLKTNAGIWDKVRPRITHDRRFAYVVKYYNDTGTIGNYDDLPYDLVTSSCMMDIWAFGLLIFSMCSQSSLLHTTIDGHLHNNEAYEELYNWSYEAAREKISASIKDPLAQDLLLKLLVPVDQRISSMNEVLQHPFFGPSSSIEAHNILEEYEERQLKNIEMSRMQEMRENVRNQKQWLSMEKHCKIIFDRLEDIMFPTGLILLPYKLELNPHNSVLETPRDQQSLSLGEMVGNQLIKLHTVIAKLSFWLRVKENLSQKGGGEFKAKVMSWIQRARTEGSESIAKEIVSAVDCDERFEGICIEMLDEEMSVSNARAFIRDPMKAAAMLSDEIIDSLLKCYPAQYLYLIDESQGAPSIHHDDASSNSYPIQIKANEKDFKEGLVPFMIVTMMVATSVDGLEGIRRLVGLPPSQGIPQRWIKSNVGFIPVSDSNTALKPVVTVFATLYGIIRRNKKELELRQTMNYSVRLPESYGGNVEGAELMFLEALFRAHDPQGTFAGLVRTCDRNDTSLTFWTAEITPDNQQPTYNEEFAQALRRLEELQEEIEGKKKLEEEVNILNERITEIKKETEARLLRRNHNESQARVTTLPSSNLLYNNSREFSSRWNTDLGQHNEIQGSRVQPEQQTPQKLSTNPTPYNTPAIGMKRYKDVPQATEKKSVFFI